MKNPIPSIIGGCMSGGIMGMVLPIVVGIVIGIILSKMYKFDFDVSKREGMTLAPTAEVIFYSKPGCPFCVQFQPTWELLVSEGNHQVKYTKLSTDKHIDRIRQDGVNRFPTIVGVKNGKKYLYNNPREIAHLRSWVESLVEDTITDQMHNT